MIEATEHIGTGWNKGHKTLRLVFFFLNIVPFILLLSNLSCPYISNFPFIFNYLPSTHIIFGLPLVAQTVKNLPSMQETCVQSLGWEDPLEKEMAPHSSTLAWRIPWT